jgi:predicted ATPase/DNA-binding XRE family transcriptional regulator
VFIKPDNYYRHKSISDTITDTKNYFCVRGYEMTEIKSFGQWLRFRRRELDLTQVSLSQEIGCAEITIRKMEADLIRPSRQLAELLFIKLGILPEEREQYISFARTGKVPDQFLADLSNNNLPHTLTSFIGRKNEVEEICRLLDSSRLLTLTGTGGIGKTRLALQSAAGVLERYSDGVWLVELAYLVDPALVTQVVAGTLGLQNTGGASDESILIRHLLGRHILIILDNCEHLLDPSAQLVQTLLQRCPNLTILATSRERLGVSGEIIYRIPSLTAYDSETVAKLDDLEQTDSVQLFVERAAAILPGFSLTQENLPTVARVCHRLNGIPLAIELAAARISSLSIEQIADFLDDQFRLLTDGSRTVLPRHRTLRASIDWSYNLLTVPERLLLQRLSVFSGGWSLQAAEAVCALDRLEAVEILDILNSLEKKSLIVVDTLSRTQVRYHMLEPIRQYAYEKITREKPTEGETEVAEAAANLQDRHLAFFLALSQDLGPRLHTSQITEILPVLDMETDNLRSAITWGLSKGSLQGAADVLGILTALDYFWAMRALYWETFPRFLRALNQLPNEGNFSAELKAWGFYVLSRLQVDFYFGVKTLEYLNQSIVLFRQVGNRTGLALALALRCYFILRQMHFFPPAPAFCEEDALRSKQECLELVHELSVTPNNQIQNAFAWVNCWVGAGALFHGALTESKFFSERSHIKFNQLGDWIGELYGWGVWLYASLRPENGLVLLPSIDHALDLAIRINHKWYQSHFHLMKATVYYRMGEYTEFEANTKQCLSLNQQVGSIRALNNLSIWFGDYYTNQQDYPKALFHLHQALDQLSQGEEFKDLYLSLEAFSVFAKLALQTQQNDLAAKLLGFIKLRLEGYNREFGPINQIRIEESWKKVRKAMAESEFQAAWYQGRAMTMEQATKLALEIR